MIRLRKEIVVIGRVEVDLVVAVQAGERGNDAAVVLVDDHRGGDAEGHAIGGAAEQDLRRRPDRQSLRSRAGAQGDSEGRNDRLRYWREYQNDTRNGVIAGAVYFRD